MPPIFVSCCYFELSNIQRYIYVYIYIGDVGDKSSASKMLDDHLKTILENVRLVYLLEREGWDATPNWEDILSLGEQQRLGMVSD